MAAVPDQVRSELVPRWRDRLVGGVAALVVGVWSLTFLVLVDDLVRHGGGRTTVAEGLVELAVVASLPVAAVVLTIGTPTSVVVDRALAGRELRVVVVAYGTVGAVAGGAVASLLPGPWSTTVVVATAGALGAVAGAVVSHRRPSRAHLVRWSVAGMGSLLVLAGLAAT